MDFKDILTQLDSMKGDEKKPVKKESKKTRPSNMLTESTDIVEPVTKEFKLPSLKNVFEELSLEPAKPGAQHIQKDGETIATVTNPQTATAIDQAIQKGEFNMDVGDDLNEATVEEAEDWIKGAVKKPGAFKAKAKRAGMSTAEFAKHVLSNKDDYPSKTEKQANLAQTFAKMKETDMPPESSLDLTSPISGGGMRESDGSGSYGGQSPLSYDTQRSSKMKKEGANMAAQYGPDDGSHNSSNDEKGNAAANAALAANDADTPQLVKEKVSKSRKLPSISKVKSMCSEGLSTSQIQQLHPKCNKQELNIMIKNTKTNLKEGADHILKAAKHMGHAHGLCKGSYACPHDEGSEGHNAYHEGYKTGLDEACGMGMRHDEAIGNDTSDVEGMGIRQAPILGMVQEEPEAEVVDSMASYGAMGEAESSPDGNVGADDDGAYDKYDWDAETVARKGIDEDDFEEGNAFTGALKHTAKGDTFKMGDKTYKDTSSLEEDDSWTFESLEKELNSHLVEGKVSTKRKLDEGYTMSITQGEENTPDRVSVNATDAEADKLIKFVKDVGLGQYGDAEVADVDAEVVDTAYYGQPDQLDEPQGSHDDMLKLMGIVDMGNGDFEDEVEAPGTDIDVQVDDAACESCGDQHAMEEGCGDKSMEETQGYDDKEDESLGMRTGKESDKHQSMKDRRDDSYGKFGKRDEEHRDIKEYEDDHDVKPQADDMHEEQGYDDKEDESLGMRTGKESDHKQSDKARRDDSYGKFGKRDSEHRKVSEEESDVERDDHAEKAGKEVAHDADYDDRRHPGKDGKDVTKDIEYDEMHESEKSLEETLSQLDEIAQLDEKQGYDDKEDESEGERDGKESGKKQSMKDRRDDSYGKFGKRDKEERHVSLEETLRSLDLLAEVGAESSEEPTQPLSQHDDERLLTKEGAEDAPKDDVNDGENEEITETQTEDQREFAVAEDDDLEEGKIPAGLKAYQDKKKGKKDDSEKDVKEEEELTEWANEAGKNGTDSTFEQDIDFMTKVISGGLNKQKSTGQTTIPVIAGQNNRTGYNGADLVKEGSVMSHDGLAGLMLKMDELNK